MIPHPENIIPDNREEIKGLSWLYFILLFIAGCISVFLPLSVTLVWAAVIFISVYSYLSDRIEWLWYAIAASPMLELWSRMSKAPFIPYEIGKYFLLLAIIILLLYHVKIKSDTPVYRPGKAILILLIPSLIVGLACFDREQWVFNILGVIEIGLLLLFSSRERWDVDRFCKTLRLGLIPSIAILSFLSVKSPGFSDMDFVLGTNTEASGGFGSNQVATVLGGAIVLTILLLMLNYPIFSYKWLSYLLLSYLIFRGLLTFSRGGMFGAGLSIVVAILPAMLSSFRSFLRYSFFIIIIGFIGLGIFNSVNNFSDNKLLLRYQGETEGTLSGSKTKNMNTFTTGRTDIMNADYQIFTDNILFGVGPGGAKSLRMRYGGMQDSAAHTEFTRLLGEHGIGGLFIAVILLLFPVIWVRRQQINKWKGITAALFMLAIFSSTHSAMRTNVTVVYYILAAMPVVMNKYWLHRLKGA